LLTVNRFQVVLFDFAIRDRSLAAARGRRLAEHGGHHVWLHGAWMRLAAGSGGRLIRQRAAHSVDGLVQLRLRSLSEARQTLQANASNVNLNAGQFRYD